MKILRPPLGSRVSRNVILLIAIFGFTNLCLAQFAEQVVLDGAFAYWNMDETAPGPATNRGALPGDATFNADVEFGLPGLADPNTSAVRLNGESAALDISNTAQANSGGPWLQKTIEIWFSADDPGTDVEQVIFEQGGSTRGMVMYVRDGKVWAGAHNSNSDSGGVASPWPAGTIGASESELAVVSTDIAADTPYHLALVMDGAAAFNEDGELDGTMTGYLNGEAFGTVEGIGTLYAHTDPIHVGRTTQIHFDLDHSGDNPYATDGRGYFFDGVVDDLALYNTALSAEQIAAHYDSRDYIVGDLDGNGAVEFADFLRLAEGFNQPGSYSSGDLTFNGHVDLADFSAFRRAFAEAAAGEPAVSAVPEPSSASLFLASVFALPLLRRRKRIAAPRNR